MTHPSRAMQEPAASPPIDRAGDDLTQFETSVVALTTLLSGPPRRLFTDSDVRRMIETFPAEQVHGQLSSETRLQALHDLMIDKDVLSDEEIMLKCAELRQALSPTRRRSSGHGGPSSDSLLLERALRELLIGKGVFSADEWRRELRSADSR